MAPKINAAAAAAGRPAPRIVAGLPVAVHDDVAEARETAAKSFANYGVLPNYRRILDIGGAAGPGDAAIVGDEAAVAAQIQALFDAGTTDVWAAPFPVGDDRSASRQRTRAPQRTRGGVVLGGVVPIHREWIVRVVNWGRNSRITTATSHWRVSRGYSSGWREMVRGSLPASSQAEAHAAIGRPTMMTVSAPIGT